MDFFWANTSKKLYNILRKYEFICFDIFDTLIKRDVAAPAEVFDLVEQEYNSLHSQNINNFRFERINAEKKARKGSHHREITLAEIYDKLPFPKNVSEELMRMERHMELAVCVPNSMVFQVYNQLISEGKTVFIVSDMYLSSEDVKCILKKCGIEGYHSLYISSQYRCQKRNGLFDILFKNESIEKRYVIHVGDNAKADCWPLMMEKGHHCKAVLIPRTFSVTRHMILRNNKNLLSADLLNSFIKNHIDLEKGYFYRIGYSVYGPMLYGYVQWIYKEISKNATDEVLFLARDSYVVQKAFEIISPRKYLNYYFYISRKSVFCTRLNGDYSVDNVFKTVVKRVIISLRTLLEHIGLYTDQSIEIAVSMGIDLENTILTDDMQDNVYNYLSTVIQSHHKEFIHRNNLFEKYLLQFVNENDRVAIIDVGWNGTSQKAISIAQDSLSLNLNIKGYYLGVNRIKNGREQDIAVDGYLVNERTDEEQRIKMKAIMGFLEFFLSSPHGTTIGYKETLNGIEPIIDHYEYINSDGSEKAEVSVLGELQKGALEFVDSLKKADLAKYIEWNAQDIMSPLFDLCVKPEKEDLKRFGDILFFDADLEYMAKPKSWIYYFAHPQRMVPDFVRSSWKPGFMRRLLFNLPFPYYSIYKLLLTRYGK